MIKKYAFLVIVLLCAMVSGFGQVTIFSENMGTATGTTTIAANTFQNPGLTFTGDADVRSTGGSSGYSGASGGRNVFFTSSVGRYFEISDINTLGYSSISLSFGHLKSTTASNNQLSVEVSSDGVTYTSLTYSRATGAGTANIWALITPTGIIPSTANLRVRFTQTSATHQFRIDDIQLSGILCTDAPDYVNVQFPTASPQNMVDGGTFDVYAQAYEPGVTEAAGVGTGMAAWIGYNTIGANHQPWSPTGWTWVAAPYFGQGGTGNNNDEFMAEIGSALAPGTYYYASRFQLNNCNYVYGGPGGTWNNDSVELIVTADQVDFCNVDYPKMGSAVVGGTFNVYTQAYEPGITNAPGAGAGLQAWIGYSATDIPPYTSPASWTWVPATYDSDFGNNDQYVANIIGGANGITATGTYYFASRWQLNGSVISYGGIYDDNIGNFWDATNNNGILTVTNAPCSDLILSEYVEGTSNNKYLEIFNGTGSTINLSNYQLQVYNNGSSSPNVTAPLSGTIPAGGVIVYRHPLATIYTGATTVLTPNPITFNGDDAVALVHSGTIIDVIGQIGFDPGTEWTGGSASTLDRTLIRKSSVQVGDSDGSNIFSPNVEWLSFPINSVSELGYHFSSCYPDRELQMELPVGTVVYCGHDYDFGNQIVNTNTDVVLRLRNLGDLPLQINSLSFATGAQFSLVTPPATPFTIPATSFQDITIRFNPNALGLFLDTLNISSNDASESSCSIDLSGISVSNCATTTEVIASQDFESSPSDTWAYTAVHAPIAGYWDVTTSLINIAFAQSGSNFWGITDLERSGHTNQTHELTFTHDVSAFSNVELSFQYYTTEIDASDTFEYQLFYNGVPQGIVDIAADTDAWTEVLINVPNSVNLLAIVFYADIDAVNDNIGLDNFVLSSTVLNTATWDGAHWNWNEGTAIDTPPNDLTTVIIDGDYDTTINGSFEACQLFVNPIYSLNIGNSTYVEVENFATIDGSIVVETHGAFVQRADFNNGFVLNPGGNASVNKSTSVINNWYDYTYWSSPVFGATVGDAIDVAPVNRRFWYNAANYLDITMETNNNNETVPGHDDIDDNGDDWQVAPAGMTMAPGQGFAATVLNSGMFPGTRQITFEGPYNTGTITTPIFYNGDNGDNDWNLIGNPYPSAISFNDLYDNNTSLIDGAAYLWSHSTIPPSNTNNGNQAINFRDDYAIINRFIGNVAGGSGIAPDPGNYIPSGQSFFVKGLANGDVTFNNAMRMANTTSNDQFFRTANIIPLNKLWINLTSDNGVFSQILIGYAQGATDAEDSMAYDTARNLSSGVKSALYSLIDNLAGKKYAIQGKDINSLDLDEVIPLGFYTSIVQPTTYKISIADLQGDFFSSNAILLKDNLLNTIFNLSNGDYVFSSEKGEFNDRFEIVFRDSALSVIENEISPNDLNIVELSNGNIRFSVNANLNIESIEIFDILGRTLYNLKGKSSSETFDLSNLSQAAYIAKVKLSNGQTITKRAVKRK
ncbi:lamin tail domain-containing protein [Subsaxibacter sp. CAU 1640]|uniref:lamin tail domain-containing protein n=1 Tax=Subsaxibacter sp. CAU 1640 TaxID=2933271 RepID=UPI0020057C48|nr:lamin tail domain-containing protein [Subsaxibacter sp. CAU 1640]MCK7589698.1 lamin tail domain-containing protein [Subsaxibacter sp. CAU 1640]